MGNWEITLFDEFYWQNVKCFDVAVVLINRLFSGSVVVLREWLCSGVLQSAGSRRLPVPVNNISSQTAKAGKPPKKPKRQDVAKSESS